MEKMTYPIIQISEDGQHKYVYHNQFGHYTYYKFVDGEWKREYYDDGKTRIFSNYRESRIVGEQQIMIESSLKLLLNDEQDEYKDDPLFKNAEGKSYFFS